MVTKYLGCVAYVEAHREYRDIDLLQTITCSVMVRTLGQNAFMQRLLPATVMIMWSIQLLYRAKAATRQFYQ